MEIVPMWQSQLLLLLAKQIMSQSQVSQLKSRVSQLKCFGAFPLLPFLVSLLEAEGSPWDEYFTPDFHSAVKSGCLPEMQFFLISPG